MGWRCCQCTIHNYGVDYTMCNGPNCSHYYNPRCCSIFASKAACPHQSLANLGQAGTGIANPIRVTYLYEQGRGTYVDLESNKATTPHTGGFQPSLVMIKGGTYTGETAINDLQDNGDACMEIRLSRSME